jgi:sugar phosphate isomerase/epimerase
MKISGRTQPLYPRYSILEALEVIRRLGFNGVEICLEVDELAPDRLTPEFVFAIREKVRTLALSPHVIGYHRDYIYDDAEFEKTKIAIQLTPAFGTNVLIFSGTAQRSGDDVAWQRMLIRTRALVQLAEDCSVVLAQEFEPGFIVGSTQDLLRLFVEIPSPNLAANLDLGHVFLCDPDPLASIRQLGSKIVHGHVENMRYGIHNHLLPQEGDMDLKLYLNELENVGFTGALALDLYSYDYAAVSPEVLKFLSGMINR